MTVDSDPRVARGPVRRAERVLAPDLIRGAMLLLIALANAAGVVFASDPGVTATPHGIERGLNLIMFTFVNARAYPVFAIMFGYSLMQLYRRQQEAGATPAAARSVLLRRNTWLVVFGLAHATFLYFGDFLGAYGIVGIVMALVLLPRGDRTHRLVLWVWALSAVDVLVFAALTVSSWLRGTGGSAGVVVGHVASFTAPNYLDGLLDRLGEWPAHTLTVLPFIMIVWLGTWAARQRILEQPEQHLTLLRRTAACGLAVAALGGLPQALLSAGLLHVDAPTASLMSTLYGSSGMFAGPGYVALFALVSISVSRRTRGPVVNALVALGRRSLSGYLAQSVAWLVLFAPYTLALGNKLGSPAITAAVIAVLVWLATVLAARHLDRNNKNGPAEQLLRRLTYGPRTRTGRAK